MEELQESDLRDFNGTPLKIGDFVIYVAAIRSRQMKAGKIVIANHKERWAKKGTEKETICVRGEKGHLYDIREFLSFRNRVENLFLVKKM